MPKLTEKTLLRALVAEFIGTFMLVFAGTGAVAVNHLTQGALGHIGVAFVFGLVIMIGVFAFGHISGAHFNPAVTLGLTLSKNLPVQKLLPYWVVQILGAITGSLAVKYLIGFSQLGITQPIGEALPAFVIELLLTMILMVVIMSVATDERASGKLAAVAIGGTIALEALFAGPLTGASMNPARSFAPALVAGDFTNLWIYILAPLIGASLGAILYKWMGKR